MDYTTLKEQHRAVRNSYPDNLNLRIHRSLSWLSRSEKEKNDLDSQFIFLWISFNAAYASELHPNSSLTEQKRFISFLKKLVDLDLSKSIYNLLWKHYSGSLRVLIDNPYVYAPFWDFMSGKISEEQWKERFQANKRTSHKALATQDTTKVLNILFSRLYVLRNQLVHGGATWNSSVNREQLRDAVRLLSDLIPTIIELMMNNPDQVWGAGSYPVVKVSI